MACGSAPREQSPLLFRRASLFFPPPVVFPAYLAPLRHRINGSQSFQLLHSFGEGTPFTEGMQRFSSAFRRFYFINSAMFSAAAPRAPCHRQVRRPGRCCARNAPRIRRKGRCYAFRHGTRCAAAQAASLWLRISLQLAALPCIARLFLSRRRKLCLSRDRR